MKYWRRYVGDLQRKTITLDPTEYGVYDLMMDFCYGTESPLPLDLDEIHTICRCSKPEHFAAVQKVLGRYWARRDDGYHNERIDEELAIAQPVIEAQREAARETNSKRHGGANGRAHALATQGPRHPSTIILQPTTLKARSSKPPRRAARAPDAAFTPPEWIPAEQWAAWIETRTKQRKPPTAFALSLAVAKLESLRKQGHHPGAVLAQSAFRGWVGLFPVKADA